MRVKKRNEACLFSRDGVTHPPNAIILLNLIFCNKPQGRRFTQMGYKSLTDGSIASMEGIFLNSATLT